MGHIPPSSRHQAHSAQYSRSSMSWLWLPLSHTTTHTLTPKKHSHSKSALAISPQSSTKINIGRNTQLHTHKRPPLSMEQREQDYMPFRLLSPSRKTQLWSSHCHTHAGTRKKVVAPPPSLRYERVIGEEGTLTHDTDDVTILKPLANKEEEGRLGPFHMYTGISRNDAFLLMCFGPLYTCSILGQWKKTSFRIKLYFRCLFLDGQMFWNCDADTHACFLIGLK